MARIVEQRVRKAKCMNVDTVLNTSPVIPVLVINDPEIAVPLAEALVAGGLRVLEVTLRTPYALQAIREMKRVAGTIVGAGTVLNELDARRTIEAGASFLVSPGLTEPLSRAAEKSGVPLLAGVASATEVMRGLDMGLSRFKFFPAQAAGGVEMLKGFQGPFPDVRFCPTGGISPDNMGDYLALPNVACVGGSWVAPSALVAGREWSKITDLARLSAAWSGDQRQFEERQGDD